MKNQRYLAEQLPAVLPKEFVCQSVADLYEHGLPRGLYTGIKSLDDLCRLDTGKVCVITGLPNDGKSDFVDEITSDYNRNYGLKTIYFSPENQPIGLHAAKLVSKLTCKPFDKGSLSLEEEKTAMNYIGDNYFFFNYSKIHSIEQILSTAKEHIDKTGAKILVLDAFNKIESECNEDYLLFVSRVLDELCSFAIQNDILILLVAHTKKMLRGEIPSPYDINGSANFFNKSDFVLTVYRNRNNEDDTSVTINVGKVRFANYGKQGMVKLNYDIASGRYYPLYDCTAMFYNEGETSEDNNLPTPFTFPPMPEAKEPLDVQVSLYAGASDNVGTVVNLKEFLLSADYKKYADYIRQGETPEERKERKTKCKDKLPCVTISGTFSQRGGKYLTTRSGLIGLDIDYGDNKSIMERVPDILQSLPYIAFYAKSISGDGYFAICKVADPYNHLEHFSALEKEFKGYGITLDKSCKDVTRLRFATYDENAYYNPTAATYLYVVDAQRPKQKTEKWQGSSTLSDEEVVDRGIQLLKERNLTLPDDYKTWFSVGMALNSAFGEKGRQYYHTLSSMSPKYNEQECDKQYSDIVSHYSAHEGVTLGTLIRLFNNTLKNN